VAPEQIIATKFGNDDPHQAILRTRPLCPYPKTAHYVGGDSNSARNFMCVEPRRQGRDGD
jgi:tannase/feruloyl esterase